MPHDEYNTAEIENQYVITVCNITVTIKPAISCRPFRWDFTVFPGNSLTYPPFCRFRMSSLYVYCLSYRCNAAPPPLKRRFDKIFIYIMCSCQKTTRIDKERPPIRYRNTGRARPRNLRPEPSNTAPALIKHEGLHMYHHSRLRSRTDYGIISMTSAAKEESGCYL